MPGNARFALDTPSGRRRRSRGLGFDDVPFTRNWKNLSALFIPATVSLLNRSTQVSDAMQCGVPPEPGRPDLLI